MSTTEVFVPTCPVADPVDKEVEPTGWKICGEEPIVEFAVAADVKFDHSVQRVIRLCERHSNEKVSIAAVRAGKEKAS